MRMVRTRSSQRGSALVIGLIMLVLVTLTVVSAFTLSSANLKAVGNIQVRDEALAAANRAIEEVVTSLLPASAPLTTPVATVSSVDINNDGTVDYTVQIAAPICVRATKAPAAGTGTLGPGGIRGDGTSAAVKDGGGPKDPTAPTTPPKPCTSFCDQNQYFSVWDINASVADATTGATTTVRNGVRILLNEDQGRKFCGVT